MSGPLWWLAILAVALAMVLVLGIRPVPPAALGEDVAPAAEAR